MFRHKADPGQRLQIARRRVAMDGEVGHHKLDLRVGVAEQIVQQILAVDTGEFAAHPVVMTQHQVAHAEDKSRGLPGGLLDAGQQAKHPFLPGFLFAHGLQQPVILRLVLIDVAGQIEDGGSEQALLNEIEDVQDAACAAIAVVERVEGLEAVVNDGHLDERIEVGSAVVVDEPLQVVHERHDLGVALRRREHRLAGLVVLERRAGQLAEAGFISFERRLNLQDIVVGDEAGLADAFEAFT